MCVWRSANTIHAVVLPPSFSLALTLPEGAQLPVAAQAWSPAFPLATPCHGGIIVIPLLCRFYAQPQVRTWPLLYRLWNADSAGPACFRLSHAWAVCY